jgi:hypothetical protein
MAHYVVCPPKKIISRIFKISGVLIVITEHMEGLLWILQNTWRGFGKYCRKHRGSSDGTAKTHGGSSEGVPEHMEGLLKVLRKHPLEGLLKLLQNTWRVF